MRFPLLLCVWALSLFIFNSARADWQFSPIVGGVITSYTSDDTYLYVSTDTGGVFRSSDLGATWEAASTGLPNKGVAAIRELNGVLYLALKDGFSGATFFSTDHGSMWTTPKTPYFGFVFCLEPKGNSMLAGTWYGVAQSTDKGNSWPTMASNGLPSNATVTALTVRGSTIVAEVSGSSAGGTGVFRSTNNGSKWTKVSDANIIALAETPSAMFAATRTGLLRSTNDGMQWTNLSSDLRGSQIKSLSTNGSNLFVTTDSGVFTSSTQGDSWTDIRANLPSAAAVTFIGVAGNTLLVGAADGVWRRPLGEVAAVREEYSSSDIRLWPNPAQDILNIDLEHGAEQVRVTNISGKEMPFKVVRQDEVQLTLDLHSYAAGVYLVHVLDGSSSRMQRIVVK